MGILWAHTGAIGCIVLRQSCSTQTLKGVANCSGDLHVSHAASDKTCVNVCIAWYILKAALFIGCHSTPPIYM